MDDAKQIIIGQVREVLEEKLDGPEVIDDICERLSGRLEGFHLQIKGKDKQYGDVYVTDRGYHIGSPDSHVRGRTNSRGFRTFIYLLEHVDQKISFDKMCEVSNSTFTYQFQLLKGIQNQLVVAASEFYELIINRKDRYVMLKCKRHESSK